MKPKICFVCLKTIKTESFNCGRVHDNNSRSLCTRFRTFTKHYLGVSFYDGDDELPELNASVVADDDHDDPLKFEVVGGKEIFCKDCESVVESIYQLYHELLTIQLRLSSKLGELGTLLEQSQEDISYKMGRRLVNLLAQQLDISDADRVDKLRSLLKTKCELRRKETMPEVKIQRDLNMDVDDVSNPDFQMDFQTFDDDEDDRDGSYQDPVVADDIEIKREIDENESKEDEEPDGDDQMSIKSELITEDEQDACSTYSASEWRADKHDDTSSEPEWSASTTSDSESDCDFTATESKRRDTTPSASTSTSKEKRSQSQKDFHCLSCPTLKSFTTKLNLSKHFKEAHSDNRFKCPECPHVSNSNRTLREHIVHSHKPETHPCPHPNCPKTFKSRKYLRDHLNQVHAGRSTRRYPCPKANCSKSYYKKQELRNHVLKNHGKSSLRALDQAGFEYNKLECSDCKKKFPNEKRLQIHIRLVHEPTPCESCGKVFVGSARKVMHFDAVHVDKPQVCSECGVTLKSRKLLKDHMISLHPLPKRAKAQIKIFICDACGMQLTTKRNLKRHVNRRHSKVEGELSPSEEIRNGNQNPTNKKKFILMQECKICGMPMKRKTEKAMELHLRTHMSEEEKRVFLCDTCGKSFSRKRFCDIHVLRDHQGVSGDFKCEECPRTFFLKSVLTTHIDRVHWKESRIENV